MERFEKVEKLVQIANVSYEDAKNALDEANGDLLDAMIILEKQGKAKKPEQSVYTTNYTAQNNQYKDVPAVVAESKKNDAKGVFRTIGDAIKKGFQYTVDNSLKIVRKGETIIKLPLWISIILLLCAWELLLIVMIISLFFDCKYMIEGKDDPKEFNDIMNQASEFAGKAKESFNEKRANDVAASTDATAQAETVEPTVEPTVENPDGSEAK